MVKMSDSIGLIIHLEGLFEEVNQIMMIVPSFRVKKPVIGTRFDVKYFEDDKLFPSQTPDTEVIDAVSLKDFKEIVLPKLDFLVKHINGKIAWSANELKKMENNILVNAIRTSEGREHLRELMKVAEFKETGKGRYG